jgi:hypothetical protein
MCLITKFKTAQIRYGQVSGLGKKGKAYKS